MSNAVANLKSFTSSAGFKKYFANTSWLMAEKILRMVVGLFVGVWVARYLGPERFGLLNYAISFVAIFVSISHMGLEGVVVRDIVRFKENSEKILGTAFLLRVVSTSIMAIFVYLCLLFTSTDVVTRFLVGIIAFGVFWDSFLVFDFYNQAQIKIKYNSVSYIIALFFSSLLKIALILFNASLIWFAIVIVVEKIVLSAFFLIFYKLHGGPISKLVFNSRIARSLLVDSIPLAITGIVTKAFMRIDQIMIKEMVGDSAVGNYAAAVKLCEMLYVIPVVIAISIFPVIIQSKSLNHDIYERRMQCLYDFVTIVSILFVLPLAIFGSKIVGVLYGNDYQQAGTILSLYIWASVFVFSGIISGRWYLVENLQKLALINTVIGLALNIVMNLYFIPRLGPIGAALSTVVSHAFAMVILNLVHEKTRDNFYKQIRAFNIFLGSKRLIREIYA